ncbi:Aminopeptidase, partial [Gryllus bimaculatus]
ADCGGRIEPRSSPWGLGALVPLPWGGGGGRRWCCWWRWCWPWGVGAGRAGRPRGPRRRRPRQPRSGGRLPRRQGASLPATIRPSDYTVTLRPDFQQPLDATSDFAGEVVLNFKLSETTSELLLHAGDGIEIQSVKISRGNTVYPVESSAKDSGTDIYRITMSSPLVQGTISYTYTATIAFKGKFQEQNNGFYKSKYVKENGETGVLFTTQFQPGHARKAFPCLDEPNFKATFQLTIRVPSGYDALSNTPVDKRTSVTDGSDAETPLGEDITFQKTPTMSSYLIAFVLYETVSFVPSYSVIARNNVPIITWAPKSAVDGKLTDYSQEITFKILRELEDYSNILYSKYMKKLDQVAVADFSAGAMENWGLVTYRESRLFFNKSSDTEAARKSVAMIIGHELTHQWFGNLVTTNWWDTTWLNEGFARYFQYLILSRIHPSWRMMDQLLLDQQMAVFVNDAVAGALTLTHDVTTAEEISANFGTITYSKGASIVRMLGYLMGEENFQKSLQKYLGRGTTSVTPANLFTDLEANLPDGRKPNTSLENAMDSWTTKSGFPVVHVERDYKARTAEISQYRFFSDGTVEDAESATIYNVPVTWSTRDSSRQRFFWFSANTTLSSLPEIENWVLVHAYGYYRVNYDEGNWLTLAWSLAGSEQARVAPADRAKLLDDAFALARIARLPYRVLGYLLRYLPAEEDVLPWAAANRGLAFLDGFLRRATAAAFTALSGFSRRGDAPELILRGNLLKLDPNLKDVIMCYGSRAADDKLWKGLWEWYVREEDATQKASVLTALGCIEDRNDLYTFFQKVAKGEDGADSTATRSAFQAAISHPRGIAAALDFVTENFLKLREWTDEETVNKILSDLANQLTSETQSKRFVNFLEEQLRNDKLQDALVNELQAKVKANAAAASAYTE